MRNPLMTRFGHTFERSAILTWLQRHNSKCPMTRNELRVSDLIRNRLLASRIQEWHLDRGIQYHHEDEELQILLTGRVEDLGLSDRNKLFKEKRDPENLMRSRSNHEHQQKVIIGLNGFHEF